jgi:phage terminase large subunit-like protein
MQASAQRLAKAGVRIEEFPQSPANLTSASQNLFDLIQSQGIVLYPDEQMRLAASRAVAKETPRGWKISKEQQSHKIDLIIALGLAAHAAVQSQSASTYPSDLSWVSGPITTEEDAAKDYLNFRMERHIMQHAAGRRWI